MWPRRASSRPRSGSGGSSLTLPSGHAPGPPHGRVSRPDGSVLPAGRSPWALGCVATWAPAASLENDVAVSVGLRTLPRDHIERSGRQREERLAVLGEQVRLPVALAAVLLGSGLQASVGQTPVEALDAPHTGHQHEQTTTHRAHASLDGPFLVARIRVAERVLEPVMRLERLGQTGQADSVGRPAAHAGGVVVLMVMPSVKCRSTALRRSSIENIGLQSGRHNVQLFVRTP